MITIYMGGLTISMHVLYMTANAAIIKSLYHNNENDNKKYNIGNLWDI